MLVWTLAASFLLASQGAQGEEAVGAHLETPLPGNRAAPAPASGMVALPPVDTRSIGTFGPSRFDQLSLVNYVEDARTSRSYWPFGRLRTIPLRHGFGGNSSALDLGLAARGFYLNDQRIQWSGLEATFAGEGALYTKYHTCSGNWITSVESELLLNQPADKNILLDTPERRSYAANNDLDTLELSRLNLAVTCGDWQFRAGKMWTPFGRYYSQLWSNQLVDAPFIRTEAIRWRETGMSLRWDPGIWVLDAGIFNGQPDRDTNSAKALVARVGADGENWALGGSVKVHDGTGSEQQKTFNRHVGLDAMVSSGRWRLSSEVIYDEYGLRYGFDPLDIFWEKSIYYRDLNEADGVPISGVGYYVTLDFTGSVWIVSLSFGQFFPEEIGDPLHDRTQNRGIVKLARSFGNCLQSYTVVMVENEGYIAQELRPREGTVILSGLQFNY